MTRRPTENLPPGADTPVDERPPYGDGRRWWLYGVAIVVGIGCAVMLGALALTVLFVVAVALLGHRMARSRRRGGVIFMNGAEGSYAGPVYRVRFFDGYFQQLTDVELSIALPSLYGPHADAALAALAVECQREVNSRDSQRCFRPRIVVVDEFGRTLRAWQAAR
jgi:hypothetical protein